MIETDTLRDLSTRSCYIAQYTSQRRRRGTLSPNKDTTRNVKEAIEHHVSSAFTVYSVNEGARLTPYITDDGEEY
jgi:hypothetical protein